MSKRPDAFEMLTEEQKDAYLDRLLRRITERVLAAADKAKGVRLDPEETSMVSQLCQWALTGRRKQAEESTDSTENTDKE